MPDAQFSEVDANFVAFQRQLPGLLATHRGKVAVIRQGEIVSFCETPLEAYRLGETTYPDGRFSIQEVTDAVAEQGYYSHVIRHVYV